jgi:hypothetical protein
MGLRGFSSKRARGGAAANHAGRAFEEAIELLARSGPIRLKTLPKCGGRFIAPGKMVNEEIPCDFIGCVIGTGRAVFFDAKVCGEDVGGLRVADDKIVKPHQLRFLRNMAEAGAVAGLLVRAADAGAYLWLPASVARARTFAWADPAWVRIGEIGRGILWERLTLTERPSP